MDNKKKNIPDNTPLKKKAEKNMEEKFQQLGQNTKVPEDLRKEVFSTLDTLNLFADIADLFTVKFSMTEIEALGIPSDEEVKENDNKENTVNGKTKKINGIPSTKNPLED